MAGASATGVTLSADTNSPICESGPGASGFIPKGSTIREGEGGAARFFEEASGITSSMIGGGVGEGAAATAVSAPEGCDTGGFSRIGVDLREENGDQKKVKAVKSKSQ
jgi:hypothetical protein